MGFADKVVVSALPLVPRAIVKRIALTYIAGEEIADAVRVVRSLNKEGAMATVDVLGEDVTGRPEAEASAEMIIQVLDAIESEKLDSNVSIKLTQLGLKIDPEFCLQVVSKIADAARRRGNSVRIDMEDSSVTGATIDLYRKVRRTYSNVGIVLQAYLRRTAADAESLMAAELDNFRLCKGIYIEPPEIAFPRAEINGNYLKVLEQMLQRKAYVGIATHDTALVEGAFALLERYGLTRSEYEFQMLLGVRPELRAEILRRGHRLRVYVPFGRQWYEYSIRRFKENPQIAGHVARALLKKLSFN